MTRQQLRAIAALGGLLQLPLEALRLRLHGQVVARHGHVSAGDHAVNVAQVRRAVEDRDRHRQARIEAADRVCNQPLAIGDAVNGAKRAQEEAKRIKYILAAREVSTVPDTESEGK